MPDRPNAVQSLPVYEKLGAFYMGRVFDPDAGDPTDELVLYDSKDLTTHAVCVGMTGSGKTGLGVSMIEEAAIDGVPVLAIDPKGDLANLMLTFPGLKPADFEPWVDPGAAQRKGLSKSAYASAQAELWKKGLAGWDQTGKRIKRLKNAADFSVYTPGSSAGRALTPIKSLEPPPAGTSTESSRERVVSTASGLCALLGVDADPIQSTEHILLSNILEHAWAAGRSLTLPTLIGLIQNPPFDRVGVMDLETFAPAKSRTALAMRLNGLLASPGFAGWLEGEALDIQKLLYTPEGKPRVTVLSIAHLGDAERMFFVTLVLTELISWMRKQPGTGSLRAMMYMDEVFGYFPPTANPPSKTPLLTLMKQARAFGVGCVLSTQNPVDLDYKGLSNAGTWMIGRLQTERDKKRLMDGLDAAGGGMDRKKLSGLLSGLDSRVFLLHNVHEDGPVLFHTRWAMSYLRGPMTLAEIRRLAGNVVLPKGAKKKPKRSRRARAAEQPVAPAGVDAEFAPVTGSVRQGDELVYRPALVAGAQLHHTQRAGKISHWRDVVAVAPLDGEVWGDASVREASMPELDDAPDTRGVFDPLPAAALSSKQYTAWKRSLKDHLYRHEPITLFKCPKLKLVSDPSEDRAGFAGRVRLAASEKRDTAVEKLRARYAKKVQTLEDRLRRAEQAIEREEEQAKQAGWSSVVSIGTSILGALLGRKKLSSTNVSKAGTAARSVGRARQQKQDVKRAEATADAVRKQLAELQLEAEREIDELAESLDPASFEIEEKQVRPTKGDLKVSDVKLVWLPERVTEGGVPEAVHGMD